MGNKMYRYRGLYGQKKIFLREKVMDKKEESQFRELLYYGMDNIIFYVNETYFQINSGWD